MRLRRRSGGGPAPSEVLDQHVRRFFTGHAIHVLPLDDALMQTQVPDFRVFVVEPRRPPGVWTYVSSGVWAATQEDGDGLEFVLAADGDDIRYPEILASVAYYHAGRPEDRLGLGHTVPMGEPMVEGSQCDHLLVSLPYPYGPDLEDCVWDGGHARLLWLLPITHAEREFKKANGLEALEQRFEQGTFEFWNPLRPSVV